MMQLHSFTLNQATQLIPRLFHTSTMLSIKLRSLSSEDEIIVALIIGGLTIVGVLLDMDCEVN